MAFLVPQIRRAGAEDQAICGQVQAFDTEKFSCVCQRHRLLQSEIWAVKGGIWSYWGGSPATAACLSCEAEAMVDAGLDVQKFLVIKAGVAAHKDAALGCGDDGCTA